MSESIRCCDICKQPIEPERIEFLTETRLCVRHAREIGRYGGEFLRVSSAVRTSKPGSLKRNYGGVDIEFRRNDEALRKLRQDYERETRAD